MADPIHHIQDAYYFEVPRFISSEGLIRIPQPFGVVTETVDSHGHHHFDAASGFCISKFMVLELVAALLLVAVFVPLARKVSTGDRPRGRFWNFFEVILIFIRDQVARPAIGKHDADRFLPLLWTIFFFILFCNLIGMVPWAGTATGHISVTAMLALVSFATVVGSGMIKQGPFQWVVAQVPHMDIPFVLKIVIWPMILVIELAGLAVKHIMLAMRLLANMLGGHIVLAVLVGFIATSATYAAWYGVMPASVLGSVGMNLLELFVAFLQAFIFTFLTALFIGMSVHPH